MKKIIFFHLLNDYSGSPKVLSQVIDAVQKKGYCAELYLGGKAGEGFLSSISCVKHRYFYKRFNNKFLTLISYVLSQAVLFFKLLKYRKSSTIFYVNTLLPFGAALAGRLLGVKVIYHIHETSIRPWPLKIFLRWVVKVCSSGNIFVSHFLSRTEGFSNVGGQVVYNAIPQKMSRVAAIHIYQPLRDGSFNVLMICSLKLYKGINEYIQIARSLSAQEIFEFTLILGATEAEVAHFFSNIEIPNNLNILFSCDDVVPYYQRASVLLSLSKPDECVETFGLTILEGLSFGIPCIVPPVGGPVELVSDGCDGYLMASDRVDDISEKLVFLQQNLDACYRLSAAAKVKSLSFSSEKFESGVLGVFDGI
ncbi:glycosyltransferase family 4 protein [Pseudomonas sp. W4I3]|uniref:glycosyltransferase family 4 protein n=1 Tax=Pseudomonas sp. W4I3 TaxID=3042294 RepID=UPI002786BD3B|nr:glycosyltransferase family 4 protein [Pseudomonas sp. W4I3]MDQ0739333.1 glycosyltransferase involved in cell wall biosynthesis [Pseudomonas sp. W4I3]